MLQEPVVMGIINVTPDSFYTGSRQQDEDSLLQVAGRMLEEGATFLDLGGQSTRPGSERISAEEEINRVLPAIEAILRHFPEALVSVDTYYARVAKAAVLTGAYMVNDISAGTLDEDLLPTVAALGVPYVLMHMQGNPADMQAAPHYRDPVLDIFDELNTRLSRVKEMGINDVIIDPGFGFGKTAAHNFQLIDRLNWFSQLGHPIMVGLSRKATVYKTLGTTAEQALNGSTVLHTVALMNGAHILRVHDVREAMEAVKLVNAIKNERAAFQLL